jgi:MarR family transcriptional regulator, 2-MHQ and catechol-resistance regulon repressor
MAIPSLSAPDEERLTTVGLLFESAAGLRRLFGRQLDDVGANTQQAFDILIRLARSDDQQLRMSELAVQASLTPSGLTRAVDRLQDQGLVVRRTCPEDRRGSFAQLTPDGRRLMAEAMPAHVGHIDRVLDELFTPEEEAVLAGLLRRIRDYTQEQNAGVACPGTDAATCPED